MCLGTTWHVTKGSLIICFLWETIAYYVATEEILGAQHVNGIPPMSSLLHDKANLKRDFIS